MYSRLYRRGSTSAVRTGHVRRRRASLTHSLARRTQPDPTSVREGDIPSFKFTFHDQHIQFRRISWLRNFFLTLP